MSHHRKLAYNHLLYWAMLEIRGIQWIGYGRWRLRWFWPGFWISEIRRVQYCGALADALHNLAMFSAHDYDGFNEEGFWEWFESLKRYQPEAPRYYRNHFERHLKELEDGTTPVITWTTPQPDNTTAPE